MGNRFASGKIAIAMCDRCGFRYRLRELRTLVVKTKQINLLVCNECWEEDHPQLQLGMYPVDDPQALRNPRRDTTYVSAGVNTAGYPTDGSRDIQWGWAPVGGSSANDAGLTPNNLVLDIQLGTVTVVTT
jgi:hypothetical protein